MSPEVVPSNFQIDRSAGQKKWPIQCKRRVNFWLEICTLSNFTPAKDRSEIRIDPQSPMPSDHEDRKNHSTPTVHYIDLERAQAPVPWDWIVPDHRDKKIFFSINIAFKWSLEICWSTCPEPSRKATIVSWRNRYACVTSHFSSDIVCNFWCSFKSSQLKMMPDHSEPFRQSMGQNACNIDTGIVNR
jgi:hypothetical protein